MSRAGLSDDLSRAGEEVRRGSCLWPTDMAPQGENQRQQARRGRVPVGSKGQKERPCVDRSEVREQRLHDPRKSEQAQDLASG